MIANAQTVTLGSLTLRAMVTKLRRPLIVENMIPGRDGGIMQKMGASTKLYQLEGELTGQDKDTTRNTLEAMADGLTVFNFAYGTTTLSVLVTGVSVPETPSPVGNFPFRAWMKEVNQPTAP